jgi:hypothetical protein
MLAPMNELARRLTRSLPLAALAVAASLAACHKSDQGETQPAAGSPPSATPAAAPAAAAPAAQTPAATSAPVKVVALGIGKSVGADGKVPAEADTFAPADTVYASVGTTGGSPGAKLTVRWSYFTKAGAQKPVGEDTKPAPAGDAATEFHVAKPEGLTLGDYSVEVLLDGKSVATKAFRVAKHP